MKKLTQKIFTHYRNIHLPIAMIKGKLMVAVENSKPMEIRRVERWMELFKKICVRINEQNEQWTLFISHPYTIKRYEWVSIESLLNTEYDTLAKELLNGNILPTTPQELPKIKQKKLIFIGGKQIWS